MFFTKVPTVDYKEVGKNDVIIDVREVAEYKRGHLPRTKNVPLSKINTFTSDSRVYVICASGARSRRATKILRKKGIDAINIRGGMLNAKR